MRAVAVLVVSGLSIAACGGGSDSSEPAATAAAPPSPTSSEAQPVATDPLAPTTTTATTTTVTTTTAPSIGADVSVTVTSPDGDLSIIVAGADHERLAPTIGTLDPADWPPEVAGAANLPGVVVYDLQPEGATFDTPVVVTRRVDAAKFPDLGQFDIPLITMLTYSDGEYELLDDLGALRLGDDIYVSGTTTHFSGLLTSSEGATLKLADDVPVGGIGDPPIAGTSIEPDDMPELDTRLFMPPRAVMASDFAYLNEEAFERFMASVDGSAETPYTIDGTPAVSAEFEGLGVLLDTEGGIGAGLATMTFEVGHDVAASAARLLGTSIDVEFDTFAYEAGLLLADVPDELYDDALDLIDEMLTDLEDDIDLVVEVFHEVFGEYPSYTRLRYRGLRLPRGLAAYSALFQGSLGNPRLISFGALEPMDGELVSESGIECFCEYGAMLLFFDDQLADDLAELSEGLADGEAFWEFVGANPDSVIGRVLQRADVDPVKTIAVGPGEGVLVDEKVTLAELP